jgi:hypothetical protein
MTRLSRESSRVESTVQGGVESYSTTRLPLRESSSPSRETTRAHYSARTPVESVEQTPSLAVAYRPERFTNPEAVALAAARASGCDCDCDITVEGIRVIVRHDDHCALLSRKGGR